jgi:hypothetical protein
MEFNFNGLHVSFQAREEDVKGCSCTQPPGQVTAMSNNMFDEKSFIERDEILTKDAEIAEIKLQDPMQYEQLLAEQEFEPGD